jgi:hypothetical protein
MTTVSFGTLRYDVALPGPGDGLPILDDRGQARASDDDLRRLGGGAVPRRGTVLPYDSQRSYDGIARPTQLRTAVLSDGRATATFLLDLGGRLWSLVVDGHEVLHQPTPLQVGNLALRNAWFAGGTEWNLGFTGHWPLTCAPVFAGVVEPQEPGERVVLRMWEYERMLGLVWRIDATIVDGTVYVHPVLANPYERDVAVYWWSNTAVPLGGDTRVLVPATDAWHYDYTKRLDLVGVPTDPTSDGGVDITYPSRVPGQYGAADHFFRTRGGAYPWICSIDADGTGFGQVSTGRLAGRKLFRWGTGLGGRRWQHWLSPAGGPGYLEVQAGLAATQLEHLPLPAGERWEWTEAYGRVTATGAHGPWPEAVTAGAAAIGAMAPRLAEVDRFLTWVRDDEPRVVATASGWGALEVAAGHVSADPATPFGAPGPQQQPWVGLANEGRFPDGWLPAPVTGPAWRERLQRSSGLAARYLEALAALAEDDRAAAVPLLQSAAKEGLWQAQRALGHLAADAAERADHLISALREAEEEATAALRLEALVALGQAGRHRDVFDLANRLPPAEQQSGRVRLAVVRSAIALGDAQTATRILMHEGLRIPDLREGEDSMESLWASYQRLLGTNEPIPAVYDFRMH